MTHIDRLLEPPVRLNAVVLAALMAALMAGCGGGGVDANADESAVEITTSTNSAENVVTGTAVTMAFDEAMDPATINSPVPGMLLTFTLKDWAGADVPGTVAMNAESTEATFTPSASALNANTRYTARVSKEAKTRDGRPINEPKEKQVRTKPQPSTGQAKVNLGRAGSFALLTKSGITNVFASVINGDVGASPITGAAIGLTCGEVKTGTVYTVDAAGPLPCRVIDPSLLTSAVGAMELAYTNAAGRTSPNFTELGAGEIGGLTLVSGLYKWGTSVSISNDVTLSGGPNDVWIFQVAGTLTQANGTRVTLTGGAQAKNVFWQAAGAVAIGTTAHFEGIMLAKTLIAVNTGASANGRLLAQTAVTLQQNTVTQPAP
ncbi:MAG: ice-binding family protein [Burkholderiaceae bacterium]